MPELPEVETIVRELSQSGMIGLKIKSVQVFWERTLEGRSAAEFTALISGQGIKDILRRGKFIVFCLSKDFLLVHLRMTGRFSFVTEKMPLPHERIRLHLSDGSMLCYQDQRKFGRWSLVGSLEERIASLGLEPLSEEFTLKRFKELLAPHRRAIKPFLLDQAHLCGIGNIYADEALWEAKIHPLQLANRLTEKEIKLLHRAIINVLQSGIEHQGTTLGSRFANYYSVSGRKGGHQFQLKVFRREGQPCSRCNASIIKIKVAQRGTHLCPICQRV